LILGEQHAITSIADEGFGLMIHGFLVYTGPEEGRDHFHQLLTTFLAGVRFTNYEWEDQGEDEEQEGHVIRQYSVINKSKLIH